MKKNFKIILFAVIAAISVTGLQLLAAINFSQKLLWQVNIMLWLAGPGPILGYDSNGKPLYEGTPIHMVAGLLGLFLGTVIYSIIFYVLRKRAIVRKEPDRV